MNPGEVWELEDGSHRLVLSHPTYNVSGLGRVITVVVGHEPEHFDPFAVHTELGTVYADRIAMHPRHWLRYQSGRIEPDDLARVLQLLDYLLGIRSGR